MVIAAAGGGDLKGLNGVVAIGASAGGAEALSHLVAGLTADVPFAYLMVLHVPADEASILARGPLFHRYAGIAEETECALHVLSDRSSGAAPHRGGAG